MASRVLDKFGLSKLPELIKPTKVNGVWHKPKLSSLALARLRNKTLESGQAWPLAKPTVYSGELKPINFKGRARDAATVER